MSASWLAWPRFRGPALDLFVLANVAFLAVDIYLAHSMNAFADPLEWVPLVFSIVATPVFALAVVHQWRGGGSWSRRLGLLTGWVAIAVGIAGFVLHLESQFFELRTLRSLVYTAPFAAPLAYAGLGFLILMNRMIDPQREEWGRWVVLLGLGGFVGNFVLALCDHAQNGFFLLSEWVPVFASAYAVAFLMLVVALPLNRSFLNSALLVLAVQAVVGMVGFWLHLRGIMGGFAPELLENVVFGPPIFAPLLFVNLAILCAVGVLDLRGRVVAAT